MIHMDSVEWELINLTPHEVSVMTENGIVTYPPCGVVARVTTENTVDEYVNGHPVSKVKFVAYEGLPEVHHDQCLYIVSAMVQQALKDSYYRFKHYLISPDTGNTAIREEGKIVAVRGFVRY